MSKLKGLIQVVQIDDKIDALTDEQQNLPLMIQELEKEIASLDTNLNTTKKEISNLESQKRKDELDLQEQRDWIAEREKVLSNIKTNKEYHAALKEVSLAKKKVFQLEEQILKNMQQIEEKSPGIKTAEAESITRSQDLGGQITEKKAEIEKLKTEVEALVTARGEVEKNVDQGLLEKYKIIRKRMTPAMALAENGACCECNTRIPPQIVIEIQKEMIITCPCCHRLLYLEEISA